MDVIEFVKVGGVAAIVAVIWFLYHKSTTAQFNELLQQQALREKLVNENFKNLIETQGNREKENFNLLKDMISNNLLQNEILQKIQSSIDNNQWCPLWRNILKGVDVEIKTKKEGIIVNESGNNES